MGVSATYECIDLVKMGEERAGKGKVTGIVGRKKDKRLYTSHVCRLDIVSYRV